MSKLLELEVLFTAEKYSQINSDFKYELNVVLYRLGGAFYKGWSHVRYRSKEEVKFADIFDSVLIPEAHLSCAFPEHYTRAPDPLPPNCYVKEAAMLRYDSTKPTALGDALLKEASIYEKLMRHPHPNIGKYHGCQVKNGRITGLCLDKYHESLMSRVNPGSDSKRWFDATQRPLKDMQPCMEGIRSGLEHYTP